MAKRTIYVCILTDEEVHVVACMRRRGTMMVVDHQRRPFRLPDSLAVEYNTEELAAAIEETLTAAGRTRDAIRLIVPGHWCFMHPLPVAEKRRRSERLIFALEEFLPMPLESVTCAFTPTTQDHTLGVAVATEPMRALLLTLQSRRIGVERITPDVVLALPFVTAPSGEASNDQPEHPKTVGAAIIDRRWIRAVLRQNDGKMVTLHLGRRHGTSPLRALKDRVERLAADDTQRSVTWQRWEVTSNEKANDREHDANDELRDGGSAGIDALAKAAASAPALVNLVTGSLITHDRWQRSQRLVLHGIAALVLSLGLWCVGMGRERNALQHQLDGINDARLVVYRHVFDAPSLPIGAAARLASERLRLEALTQSTTLRQSGPTEPSPSATPKRYVQRLAPLDLLRAMVVNLPKETRIMLLEARVDDTQLTLRGQTRKHRDAERIAEAVNRVNHLTARPPRTNRLADGGVEFSLTARMDVQNESTRKK